MRWSPNFSDANKCWCDGIDWSLFVSKWEEKIRQRESIKCEMNEYMKEQNISTVQEYNTSDPSINGQKESQIKTMDK